MLLFSFYCLIQALNSSIFYSNDIEFLNRESFLGLTSLKELDFSSNPIKNISDDAFVGLRNLSRLDLSRLNAKITMIVA